jgi:quercetin dioxygenase-like cupin family protein
MRIIPVHETAPDEHNLAVREVFLNRTVISCGMAEFPPGHCAHEGEKHVHEHDEVFIVLSGEVTVPVPGRPVGVARAGDWALVEAGEEHHLTNHTGLPCRTIFLVLQK